MPSSPLLVTYTHKLKHIFRGGILELHFSHTKQISIDTPFLISFFAKLQDSEEYKHAVTEKFYFLNLNFLSVFWNNVYIYVLPHLFYQILDNHSGHFDETFMFSPYSDIAGVVSSLLIWHCYLSVS